MVLVPLCCFLFFCGLIKIRLDLWGLCSFDLLFFRLSIGLLGFFQLHLANPKRKSGSIERSLVGLFLFVCFVGLALFKNPLI